MKLQLLSAAHAWTCFAVFCCGTAKTQLAWMRIGARRTVPGLSAGPIHSQGEGRDPAGSSNEPPGPSIEVGEAGRWGWFSKWLHKLIRDGCARTGKAQVPAAAKCAGQVRKASPFSPAIIMMTVFLHAFVSFNHV